MLILGTHTALFKYWGSGPMWPFYTGIEPNCKDYWWRNLLYINNLFSNTEMVKISVVDICMSVEKVEKFIWYFHERIFPIIN